ncbi:hypothetical protein [Haliangium ochraceum]|uniref:Putative secreted protein n=1 Tax=Haliangium ochraceum (strain DSM 14365 / JCM 11303 / SMP-2) TaxID=502025 RepID=D0LLX9_HALO1|nr:hypothetical protein [Haliangium ochraceum]ACY15157.1 putative secreted protein [Haliangium ochraceum DSM 14365]
MQIRSISAIALTAIITTVALAGCTRDEGTERWAATSNTNVDIDWDKVQEAYKTAEGPKDFETKVNEIYEGDELISVAVEDKDAKTQQVTGFFDQNVNGTIDEGEKIFEIQRDIVSDEQAQYQVQGYGHYGHYRHTSMWDIAGGVVVGSMLANALMPGYRPMYSQPYVTSSARRGQLNSHRSSYRAANPSRFQKASGSGRSYGSKGSSWGSRSSGSRSFGSRGGGGFGIDSRRRRKKRIVRLDA